MGQLKLTKNDPPETPADTEVAPSTVEVASAGGFSRPERTDYIDVAEIESETTTLQTRASALTIESPAEYTDAAEFLKAVRRVVKQVDDTFAQVIKDAHTLHRNLTTKRNEHREPLYAAEREIKQRMGAWSAEQERIRVQAEQAERKRLAAEAEMRRLEEAETLEETGQSEAADAILEAPPPPPPPVVIPTNVPKPKGISVRLAWRFRIVDMSLVPDKYKTIDEKKIAGVVRALKKDANIPGVEVYPVPVTAVKV